MPQNLSVPRKRSTSAALEREQHKRRQASMEVPPGDACAQKGRHSKRCLRISRAGRHLLQNEHRRKTRHVWPGLPSAPPPGGRHTVERPHLPQWEGIGAEVSAGRVWCDSFVRCEGARHHPTDGRPPGGKATMLLTRESDRELDAKHSCCPRSWIGLNRGTV